MTWAIATSSRAAQVATSVAALELAEEPRIVDGSAVEHAKPAPDLLLLAADRLGVAARRDVVRRRLDLGHASGRGGRDAGDRHQRRSGGGRGRLRDAGAAIVLGTLDELELPG